MNLRSTGQVLSRSRVLSEGREKRLAWLYCVEKMSLAEVFLACLGLGGLKFLLVSKEGALTSLSISGAEREAGRARS